MKQPGKWTNNRLDRAFKDWVNSVRDYLVDVSDRLTSTDKRLNARIDNLVAPGNKPSDDNEIRDARTDYDGKLHGSLKARLDSDRKRTVDSFNETNDNLAQANNKITEVDNKLTRLYDEKNKTKTVYVSQERGDDTTGDGTQEKPFKSIQRAVDELPVISSAQLFVNVEKGAYKEDVRIEGVHSNGVTIEAYNHANTQPEAGPLAVFVRTISFINCPSYCRVRGIEFFDSKNLIADTTGHRQHIFFQRVFYGSVSNARFVENSKALNVSSIAYDSSVGSVYSSHFETQANAIKANYMSQIYFAASNSGKGNDRTIYTRRSIIFKENDTVSSENADVKYSGGQIFE